MHFGSLMLDRPHAKRCEGKSDIDCELRTHVKLASFRRHQSSSTVCIPAEPTSFCSGVVGGSYTAHWAIEHRPLARRRLKNAAATLGEIEELPSSPLSRRGRRSGSRCKCEQLAPPGDALGQELEEQFTDESAQGPAQGNLHGHMKP